MAVPVVVAVGSKILLLTEAVLDAELLPWTALSAAVSASAIGRTTMFATIVNLAVATPPLRAATCDLKYHRVCKQHCEA